MSAPEPPAPVDLDLAFDADRWEALTAIDIGVQHDGDASKVIPFPRPAWADPDSDHVDRNISTSYYQSHPAYVAASMTLGNTANGYWDPAEACTAVTMYGNGDAAISLRMRSWISTKERRPTLGWASAGVKSTTIAAQLAHVLMAASDLAEEACHKAVTR